MRAADVSNWSGTVTTEQARCLRTAGVERLICGTQVRATTRAQIAAATAASLQAEAYVILRWPVTTGDTAALHQLVWIRLRILY